MPEPLETPQKHLPLPPSVILSEPDHTLSCVGEASCDGCGDTWQHMPLLEGEAATQLQGAEPRRW